MPFSDFGGHIGGMTQSLRAFALAYISIYWIHGGDDGYQYAAFGRGATFDLEWMLPILYRNLIGTWLICGFWDYILYFSPLASGFKPYKIIAEYPTNSQFIHDAFWTTSATVTATVIEWFTCYLMATGSLSFDLNMADKPLKYVFWALFLTHVREPHFYCLHRLMHPWRKEGIPDIGKFLYKHVHSLHHKSSNITSFSGTNMHPVESTLYYTPGLIAAYVFACHPVLALGM